MDSEERVCPVCGQPVETVVRRHKTLGAWVPVWGPGPCRNPGCEAYGAPDTEEHGRSGGAAGGAVGNRSDVPPGETRAPQPARRDSGTNAGTGTRPTPSPGPAPGPGPENS